MPGIAQGFQEHVAGFYRKFTSAADSTKEGIVIGLTVRLAILQVENIVTDGISTGHAHKTGNMPSLFQSIDDFSKDLPLASATFRSEEFLVAQLTIQSSLFLHKSDVGHCVFAVSTVKFLWVPGFPQGHEERSPDDLVAVRAHGSPFPCRDVLRSLHEGVLVAWLRLPPSGVGRGHCS